MSNTIFSKGLIGNLASSESSILQKGFIVIDCDRLKISNSVGEDKHMSEPFEEKYTLDIKLEEKIYYMHFHKENLKYSYNGK